MLNKIHLRMSCVNCSAKDDLVRKIYILTVIEQGMVDSEEGRAKDVQEVRVKCGML